MLSSVSTPHPHVGDDRRLQNTTLLIGDSPRRFLVFWHNASNYAEPNIHTVAGDLKKCSVRSSPPWGWQEHKHIPTGHLPPQYLSRSHRKPSPPTTSHLTMAISAVHSSMSYTTHACKLSFNLTLQQEHTHNTPNYR